MHGRDLSGLAGISGPLKLDWNIVHAFCALLPASEDKQSIKCIVYGTEKS